VFENENDDPSQGSATPIAREERKGGDMKNVQIRKLWILTLALGVMLSGAALSSLTLSGCSKDKNRDTSGNLASNEQDQTSGQGSYGQKSNSGQNQTTPPASQPARTSPPAPSTQREPVRSAPTPTSSTKLVSLEKGTSIVATLDEKVSTESDQAGQSFTATLAEPVAQRGLTVLPSGSRVRGDVTFSKKAPRVGGKAQMTLEFKEVTLPDGKSYPLHAEPLALVGEGTGKGDVGKVVGGAVGGAIIGGILGGKGGAVKGGAAGSAAGAAWAVATRGNDIVLDPGSKVSVTLVRPLDVAVVVPAGQAVP
jgi:hypothetical protein